ncbi:MAG: pilus assembly protein TadG-related protein [Alphaproteobacteria bacterium]|nr:pilus assembly protein TadG-related protein [Alphaproteobacteria bacterium]
MLGRLAQLFTNRRGNFAISAAILAMPLLAVTGGAIDFVIFSNQKTKLQAAAESAALASVLELGLSSTKESDVKPIAETYVMSNFREDSAISLGAADDLKVMTDASKADTTVKVDLEFYWQPIFAHLVSDGIMPIKVSATATLAGVQSICVIALDTGAAKSLHMSAASTMKAVKCGIYANSTHKRAIEVVSSARMASAATYSSGGYRGPVTSYKPKPVTDSPPIRDPLMSRPAPPVGPCKEMVEETGGTHILDPGTYCGGIVTKGKVTLKFRPGIYVIKDGPLKISGDSTVIGKNVGFFFTGDKAVFNFGVSTQAKLTAPKKGPMAGILFYEDRASTYNREFVIRSKDAELFEGTVYLPKGKLIIDKKSRVGQRSAWTAIIANRIESRKGPQVVINSNYASSTIPVPAGIAPEKGRALLIK